MHVRIGGKLVHRAQAVPVEQPFTARNVAPTAPPEPVQLRLALADGRRVVVEMTPAEATRLGQQLLNLGSR